MTFQTQAPFKPWPNISRYKKKCCTPGGIRTQLLLIAQPIDRLPLHWVIRFGLFTTLNHKRGTNIRHHLLGRVKIWIHISSCCCVTKNHKSLMSLGWLKLGTADEKFKGSFSLSCFHSYHSHSILRSLEIPGCEFGIAALGIVSNGFGSFVAHSRDFMPIYVAYQTWPTARGCKNNYGQSKNFKWVFLWKNKNLILRRES